MDAHNGGLEDKTEHWRFCRPVVADSHHFDEEQDPDLSALKLKLDPNPDPH